MVRSLALSGALLWLGPVGAAAQLEPREAEPQEARRRPSWLRLSTPAAETERVGFAWLELRGEAQPRGGRGHDVVLVLDLSDSTLGPSGVDLDGDGGGGVTDATRLASLAEERDVRRGLLQRLRESDFEDSVLAAELAAARTLIDRLDLGRSRLGLVHFSDEAWLIAPVGSERERLEQVLGRIERTFFRDLRGTNFAAAIDAAVHALLRAGATPEGAARERSILFLSDGTPTLPVHADRATELARLAAAEAGAAGIRIYGFALGAGADAVDAAGLEVFAEVARLSGGRFEALARPADVISRLRHIDLADLAELRIENRSNGSAARALRVFPDGSFDGFVKLAPGENRIRVRARASDGRVAELERRIVLDAGAGSEAESAALREALRLRTRETQLWAEVERGRRDPSRERMRRELELEPQR